MIGVQDHSGGLLMRISLFSSLSATRTVTPHQRFDMTGLTYYTGFVSHQARPDLVEKTQNMIQKCRGAALTTVLHERSDPSSTTKEICRYVIPPHLPHAIYTQRTSDAGQFELFDFSTSPFRTVEDSIPKNLRATLMTHLSMLKQFQELQARASDNYLHFDFSIAASIQSMTSRFPLVGLEWPVSDRFPEMSDLKVIIPLSGPECTFEGESVTSLFHLKLKPCSALCLTKEAQRDLFERTKMFLHSTRITERISLIIDVSIPPQLPQDYGLRLKTFP